MALNKKSVTQIVVLVVLLVVAGGAFLMQQEGGLDFITDMIGGSEPAATKTATPGEGTAPAAKPAPLEPVIPVQPVRGDLNGKPFVLERAYIERGVLVLLSGTDSAGVGVSVQLPARQWEVPVGKRIKYLDAKGAGLPLVRVGSAGEGGALTGQQEFRDKYSLVLELGQELDRRVPGRIYLALPGGGKSVISGTFTADVRGFRIVDGKPDLGSDSVDTLQYLALRNLLKDDPDKNVTDIQFRGGRVSDATARIMSGYLEMEYRVGDAAPAIQRLQFSKEKGEWRVAKPLKLNEIDEAHPLGSAPGAKDAPAQVLAYLAAKRLEADLHKKAPKQGIFDTRFDTRVSDKHKIGQCEASYRLESAIEPVKVTYLLRKKSSGWALDRELGKKEHINFDTGKIEKR
jgi:hypothetical protein